MTEVQVDIDLLRLEDGDRLLLCSDGLTDLVDDDTIATTLSASRPSSEACSRLVQLALDGGGRDNITVIVAEYTMPTDRRQRRRADAAGGVRASGQNASRFSCRRCRPWIREPRIALHLVVGQ